jgi:hypothetical protein
MNPTPFQRFLGIADALEADRRWYEDASPLRYAAMAAADTVGEPEDIAAGIRQVAETLKEGSGYFGELNGPLRFAIAAVIYQRQDTPETYLVEVERVRDMLRERKLRRGGIYEAIATLIMRVRNNCAPIRPETIDRFVAFYEALKADHWWLTGPDDFPACAILATRGGEVSRVAADIEELYQDLHKRRFFPGDSLQAASILLNLVGLPPALVTERFEQLYHNLRAARVTIVQDDYDELALLASLATPVDTVTERVIVLRDELLTLKPRPDRSIAFNMACGLAFQELSRTAEAVEGLTDAKILMDLQTLIAMRQMLVFASVGVVVGAT